MENQLLTPLCLILLYLHIGQWMIQSLYLVMCLMQYMECQEMGKMENADIGWIDILVLLRNWIISTIFLTCVLSWTVFVWTAVPRKLTGEGYHTVGTVLVHLCWCCLGWSLTHSNTSIEFSGILLCLYCGGRHRRWEFYPFVWPLWYCCAIMRHETGLVAISYLSEFLL